MLTNVFTVALLSGLAVAAPELEKRAPQATSPQDFSSAVSQLISLYIPSSVATPIGFAIVSAAAASGISGAPDSLVISALAAPTPPPFLSAVPSQYQSNIVSLGSAISALRGVASTGINGAPIVGTDSAGATVTSSVKNAVTTTDSAGATILGLTGSSGVTSVLSTVSGAASAPSGAVTTTDSAGATILGLTGSSGVTSVISTISGAASAPSGAVTTTDSAGSTITGLAATTTDSAGSTVTSLTSTVQSDSGNTESTTTTSTDTATESATAGGSAAPSSTQGGAGVPVAPAPGAGGLLGLIGLALAL